MKPRDFEQVVNAHYADLYRFAYSLARNPHDAGDLTQQAFVVFAQRGGEIRDASKCKSWLFTTLYRDFLKQGVRANRVVCMDEADLAGHAAPTPADSPRLAEHNEVLEALTSLEDDHRVILSLFYLEDRSYKGIAEVLDLPIGTVMSRLSRAKAALRERLQNGSTDGINSAA